MLDRTGEAIRIATMETWAEIFRSRKFWAAVIASLIIKELITRLSILTTTGILKLWSKILYVITLDSAAVRDAPYASAAVDPYPVPPLMLLTGVLLGVIAISLLILGRGYWYLVRGYLRSRSGTPQLRGSRKVFFQNGKLVKKNLFVLLVGSVYISGFCVALAVPVGIANEAVLSRRYYEADRDIVAPYMTPTQLTQLQADFAQIETKAQYKAIMDRLATVADEHHVKIHKFDW
jgi:hypothetical protein